MAPPRVNHRCNKQFSHCKCFKPFSSSFINLLNFSLECAVRQIVSSVNLPQTFLGYFKCFRATSKYLQIFLRNKLFSKGRRECFCDFSYRPTTRKSPSIDIHRPMRLICYCWRSWQMSDLSED